MLSRRIIYHYVFISFFLLTQIIANAQNCQFLSRLSGWRRENPSASPVQAARPGRFFSRNLPFQQREYVARWRLGGGFLAEWYSGKVWT